MLDNKSIENLKIVLDFVERWNKQDKEPEVAQACLELEKLTTGYTHLYSKAYLPENIVWKMNNAQDLDCNHKNTKVYLGNGRRTSKFKRCVDCGKVVK